MSSTRQDKLDLFKAHKDEYSKPKRPERLTIGPARYLSIDGVGAPGDAAFQDAIGALYGMAYTVKFQSKFAGKDFVVCKLETLWGAGAGAGSKKQPDLSKLAREQWPWRMMIRVPDFIEEADLATARATLAEKGKEGDFDAVRLEHLEEGNCVQLLHVGPYDKLGESIDRIRAFLSAEGLRPRSWQHDVYLNDPRRVPPERLQTIVRQPFTPG